MQEYGGPATPGLGFALGFERTVLAMEACGAPVEAPSRADVYIARVDESVAAAAFALTAAFRDAGITAEEDHQKRSLKSQFKQADRLGARFVAILGPDEVAAGTFTLRDMSTKEESAVAVADAASIVMSALGR